MILPCCLMAEIGDVTRFAHKNTITFADVDPGADQSGTYKTKSTGASKSGPPELRKALFPVMDCLLKTMPQDDTVCQLSASVLRLCDSRKLSYESASERCRLSSRYFGDIVRGKPVPTFLDA